MPNNDLNKIGEIAEHQIIEDLSKDREDRSRLKIGDKVTCRSIPAKSLLLGRPTTLELATYPSLIGVELTIESFQAPFIICTRTSGSYAPALMVEDLEMWSEPNE